MSDITTKLRSGIHDLIRLEAAREIDRLRTDASAKDAEIASLIAANGDLQRWFDAAFSEFTRKDQEIARLREALTSLLGAKCWEDDIAASAQARAALAPVEVGNG